MIKEQGGGGVVRVVRIEARMQCLLELPGVCLHTTVNFPKNIALSTDSAVIARHKTAAVSAVATEIVE
jgi:hypothetical protein